MKKLKLFLCKYLGWHTPLLYGKQFDGANVSGYCADCGKEIIMDSQGNWFSA